MATVTDEDWIIEGTLAATKPCSWDDRALVIAEARERIETRVRAECDIARTTHTNKLKARIADLEAQLAADEVAHCNCARALRDSHAKVEGLLAASKPVLTVSERAGVEIARQRWEEEYACLDDLRLALAETVAIIDRLCPPPKAPPSDAELADMLADERAALEMDGRHNVRSGLTAAIDALRARGAK